MRMLSRSVRMVTALAVAALAAGCATPERSRSDADALLRERSQAMAAPQQLATRYTDALVQFGRMLEVYRREAKAPLYVQSRNIADATGLSHPLVGSELPGDITEMVRSAVNRIGDKVVYVPFHPDYVMGHVQQGAKLQLTLPDLLITGAITEFDRALSNAGRGDDLSVIFGKGKGETDSTASRKVTATVSRLSLDFNLVDFSSQTMLPRMQATNSMRVLNETYEDAFDFAIYGNGFGLQSNTRYLQGRHNAIRLLVDLSVVQLLGRYSNVPYWRCLPNAVPDEVVRERIASGYRNRDSATRTRWLQDTLRDYGFPLEVNGRLDEPTRSALDSVASKFRFTRPGDWLDPAFFVELYVNVPIDKLLRRG
jgi:curli biogenesis system outer membrane secretion channel CsgG